MTGERTRHPTFAIIVPTYNEEVEIGATCDALLDLVPRPDEIIFVDGASTDDTAGVIRRHRIGPSMRLIVEDSKRGPATARNVGIKNATSDVVVFVDADVQVPRNFLARLSPHYEHGADAVAVEMRIANTDNPYGRFMQAVHEHAHGHEPLLFSQAFSCRRSVALDAGLFPEGLPGAEDFEFGRRLAAHTDKRITDRSIIVRHTVPDTLGGFWRLWQWRGASLPFLRHQVHQVRRPYVVAERTAAACWSLLLMVTVVPTVAHAVALARRSKRGWADTVWFLGLVIIHQLAHRIGEWQGIHRLYRGRSSDAR